MFSKTALSFGRPLFSTSTSIPAMFNHQATKDYQYVRLIENAPSIEAYNLLLHSHMSGVTLDIPVFNTVYQKTKTLDQSYHSVLFNVYSQYFKNSIVVLPLLQALKISDPTLTQLATQEPQKLAQPAEPSQTLKPVTVNNQSKVTNPALVELMTVLKSAARSRSNLVLNNVELSFDYEYLFGNPLANQGLEEYDEVNTGLSVQPDSNDILSCLKDIKIGQIQIMSPESNFQI